MINPQWEKQRMGQSKNMFELKGGKMRVIRNKTEKAFRPGFCSKKWPIFGAKIHITYCDIDATRRAVITIKKLKLLGPRSR